MVSVIYISSHTYHTDLAHCHQKLFISIYLLTTSIFVSIICVRQKNMFFKNNINAVLYTNFKKYNKNAPINFTIKDQKIVDDDDDYWPSFYGSLILIIILLDICTNLATDLFPVYCWIWTRTGMFFNKMQQVCWWWWWYVF